MLTREMGEVSASAYDPKPTPTFSKTGRYEFGPSHFVRLGRPSGGLVR
jgi:hypothetical protein